MALTGTTTDSRGVQASSSRNGFALQKPLRICHLGKFYPPAAGGIETHVQTLARTQAELGAKVQVICVNHLDARGRDVTWQVLGRTSMRRECDAGVDLLRCGRWGNLARLDLCPAVFTVLRRLSPENTDVLHLHTPNPTMLLALAVLSPRLPLVVTHHSDVIRQRFLGKLIRPFEHRVYSQASRVLTTSPCYANGSELLHDYQDRVEPLPLGIDLEPFLHPSAAAFEAAARWRNCFGWPIWLSVGRLIYYKGLSTGLKALRHVPGTYVIIGTGPLRAKLEAEAKSLGVADRVAWLGELPREELVGAYHAATALWFPSCARSEGFGLVQVEAMASGCPVINTAIPHSGVPWVSRHEETGLTIPVGDSDALAEAARRLHEDEELRRHLGQQARQRAIEQFSARRMAEKSLRIYAAVLASNRSGKAL
ncbi:MAG: glycosyltransferase [Gemmatales bacterium]|nr:glycosyltransferase [Gemmatales bacterium]MDW8386317.1 glycosyltransferase [Gemmatales bacterium]